MTVSGRKPPSLDSAMEIELEFAIPPGHVGWAQPSRLALILLSCLADLSLLFASIMVYTVLSFIYSGCPIVHAFHAPDFLTRVYCSARNYHFLSL